MTHSAREIIDSLFEAVGITSPDDADIIDSGGIEGGVLASVFHNPPSTPAVTLSPDGVGGEAGLGDGDEKSSEDVSEPSDDIVGGEYGAVPAVESCARMYLDKLTEAVTWAHLTKGNSSNGKTGRMPVSMTTQKACPDSCPFKTGGTDPETGEKTGGCYATGSARFQWPKLTRHKFGTPWSKFCKLVAGIPPGTLWRHNQAGDLPGEGEQIDGDELRELVAANEGKRGFTYTHKYNVPENIKLIRWANDSGFTINLSANNAAHADELVALGAGPVCTVIPSAQLTNTVTPGGNRIVICPNVTRGLTCDQCGLCQKQRAIIVGFPAHGSSVKKANEIASRGLEPVAADKLDDILGKILLCTTKPLATYV